MVLYIKDAETRALAKQLAKLTGESLPDTVKHALQVRLEQVESLQGEAPNLDRRNQHEPQRKETQRHKRRGADRTAPHGKWGVATKAVRGVVAASAKKTRAAALRAAGNAPRGVTRVRDGAKDAALRSAGKARDGAVRVKEGAKDATVWAAVTARDGVTTGLSVTQSYGAPVITGVAAGVLAISDKVRATDSFQKMLGILRDPIPFWDAYGHLSRFSQNLDWANADPRKYLFAGTRGTSRGLVEAQKVWETIPEQIRAAGPEATAKYLEGKDWSHIRAYSEGGSNLASNGVFENATLNRARGAAQMTRAELEAAERVLQRNAFHATLLETATSAMEGALTAAAIAGVMAVLEYGLQYQRGDISEGELYQAIGKTVLVAGISGAAISSLVVAMAMAFPATIPVVTALAVPLMVIGFSVLGVRLVKVGKGWYKVYLSEQPLRPLALQYWLVGHGRAVAEYVRALKGRRLTEEAAS